MKAGTKIFWGLVLAGLLIAVAIFGRGCLGTAGNILAAAGGGNTSPSATTAPAATTPPATANADSGGQPKPATANPPPDQILTTDIAAASSLCNLPSRDADRYFAVGPVIGVGKQLVVQICHNPEFAPIESSVITKDGLLVVAQGEQGVMMVDVSKDLRPGGYNVDRFDRLVTYFPGRPNMSAKYNGTTYSLQNPLVVRLGEGIDFCTKVKAQGKPSDDNPWMKEIWARCMASGDDTPGGKHNKAVAQTMAWASRADMAALNADVHKLKSKIDELDQKVVTTPIPPKQVDFNAGGPSK